jgi:DNA-binding response OmpR family regulator
MEHAKIMVVDKHDGSASLASLLKAHGFGVASAARGEEALRIVAGVSPDLVIMNVQLAGRNGYEITRELRDRALADGVPVILLTSAQTEEAFRAQREWGIRAGATEVLAKPVDEHVLLAKVRALVAGVAPGTETPVTGPTASLTGAGLSERALEELERRLAQYIGPISKMLVRKVEREVTTTSELYRRLAEHITDKSERERFISWAVTQA